MALTQIEELEKAIQIVSEWNASRQADEIIAVFFNLEELDLDKDPELWDQLRQAIADNEDFQYEGFQKEMKILRKRAKLGYWFWNI
jgi:hypothetical protein